MSEPTDRPGQRSPKRHNPTGPAGYVEISRALPKSLQRAAVSSDEDIDRYFRPIVAILMVWLNQKMSATGRAASAVPCDGRRGHLHDAPTLGASKRATAVIATGKHISDLVTPSRPDVTRDCGLSARGSIRINNIKPRVVAGRIPDSRRGIGDSK